jgi:hypothetical protein
MDCGYCEANTLFLGSFRKFWDSGIGRCHCNTIRDECRGWRCCREAKVGVESESQPLVLYRTPDHVNGVVT